MAAVASAVAAASPAALALHEAPRGTPDRGEPQSDASPATATPPKATTPTVASEALAACQEAKPPWARSFDRVRVGVLAICRMQLLAERAGARKHHSQARRSVQGIADSLSSPANFQADCLGVFETFKVPLPRASGFGLPTSSFPDVLRNWHISEDELPLAWALLRQRCSVDATSLPEVISFETFEEVLGKLLRRVRDRVSKLQVKRARFVTENRSKMEDSYTVKGIIGEGAFGVCRWIEHKVSHERYVCKTLAKNTAVLPEDIEAELEVMKQLDHPNILRVFQWFETEDHFSFVLEAAFGGDLRDALARAREVGSIGLGSCCVRSVAQQSLYALSYIHSRGVIHRDIKPANLLLAKELRIPTSETDVEAMQVLLSDFGVSELCKGCEEDRLASVVKGTLLYMAPEVFGGEVSAKSDIWALGVTLMELLCSRRPFAGDNPMAVYSAIRRSEPNFDPIDDLQAKAFVECLVAKHLADRPTARESLELPWISPPGSREAGAVRDGSRKIRRGLRHYARTSTFSKTVSNCIAAHLNTSQVEHLTAVFKSLDENRDGVLSIEELRRSIDTCGIDRSTVGLLIDSADVDHDGQVNYTEFIASLLATLGDVEEQMLERAFAVFDADRDGSITLEELNEMITGGGPVMSILPDGTTVEEVLRAVDTSGDGTVSKQEFCDYLREQRKLASAPGPEARSERAPADSEEGPRALDTEGDAEPIAAAFARLAECLQAAPHPQAAPDYAALCAGLSRRLGEAHWLFTVGDLRMLSQEDWPALGLPLKLLALLRLQGILSDPARPQ